MGARGGGGGGGGGVGDRGCGVHGVNVAVDWNHRLLLNRPFSHCYLPCRLLFNGGTNSYL